MSYTIPGMATRTIDVRVQVQWAGGNPLDDQTWTNETPYFISASGKLQLLPGFDHYANNRVSSQQMSLLFSNQGYRYSPHIAGSQAALYAATGGIYHKRVRIQVRVNSGAWQYVFSGFAKWIKEDYKGNTVTITVHDVSESMRSKHSTPALRNYREHELIAYYMTLAGLVDGVDFISPAYDANHATLDYSSVKIPYSWLDDEEIWQELGDVAQASSGRIFVGRDGRVNFWKMWRWSSDDTPEIIRMGQYSDISPVWDDKAFYDEIVVDYAERAVGGPGTEVWELRKSRIVNAGQTEIIEARVDSPTVAYQAPVNNEDYAIRSLGGDDASAGVTINYAWGAQLTKISITNNLGYPVMVAKFTLKGSPLVGSSSEQHTEKLQTPFIDRRLDVRGNPYMQTKSQAELAAKMWAWWYREPKPLFSISGVRGEATRNLGDRLSVETHGTVITGPIIEISWNIGVTKKDGLAYTESYVILDGSRFAAANGYLIIDQDVAPGSGKVLWH